MLAMPDSCALLDTNIIMGHSNEFMTGDRDTPEYLEMLKNFQTLFYAEPTYQEVVNAEKAKAKRNKESLSEAEIHSRADSRLFLFIQLPRTEISEEIASEIEERLRSSCLEESQILRMMVDIAIISIGIYHLKLRTKVIVISDNLDFLYIECAVPEDIEVWTAKSRKRKAKHYCRRITESMAKENVDLYPF